jgi:sec-independent protein translocase protein TatB
MLDIGWTELLVVGVVALIVIGPRDLPGALRTFGKYVGQVRRMARQFQDGIDDIARQEDLRELQRTVTDVTDPKAIDKYLSSDIEKPSPSEAMKIGSIDPRNDADLSEIDGAAETAAVTDASASDGAVELETPPEPTKPAASS